MAARISASSSRAAVAGPARHAPAEPGGDQEARVRDGVERLGPVARVGPLAIAVDRTKPVHRHSLLPAAGCAASHRRIADALVSLGHSGFRIEIADQVLLLDPWLGNPLFDNARREVPATGR